MKGDRHVRILAVSITAIGLGLVLYKTQVLGFPLSATETTEVWNVQARIRFVADGGPAKIAMELPSSSLGYTLVDEDFVSRGYGLQRTDDAGSRVAEWSKREARGFQTLYYRTTLRRGVAELPRPAEAPSPPRLEEPFQTAMLSIVDRVRARSADARGIASQIVQELNDPMPDEAVDLFLRDARSARDRAQVAVILLRGAGLAARQAHGIRFEDQQRTTPEPWLEIDDGRRWFWVDPRTGTEGLPEDIFLWWRGELPMVRILGGSPPELTISTQRNPVDTMALAERTVERRGSKILELSLLGLPVQTQALYAVLLMVPVGALVIVLLRNVVGIKTFGTFLPVLVALAFRETRLIAGILLFALVVGLGLVVRFYFERLRLLLVPRLAAVLTLVVILMLMISIIGFRLGFDTGLSVALFPMVILAIAIEHMSIVWEELGSREALQQGLGTLAVAALVYLVISRPWLQDLMVVYPELLLVVLGGCMVIGRYSGFRLLELRRFQALARDAS